MNPQLPYNQQDVGDIPLDVEDIIYLKKKKYPVQVKEVITGAENKRLFKATSSSEVGKVYDVQRLKTIAGTIVYKCDCIGYMARARKNPFFICKHIAEIKKYLVEKD